MKKLLFSLFSLIMFCTLSAQNTVMNGDLNNDGKFSVADIVTLNNIVKKKIQPKVIDGNFAIGSADTQEGIVLFGDMNHDGKFTYEDIELLAETFLEIKEEEPVTGDFEVRDIVTAEIIDGWGFYSAIWALTNGNNSQIQKIEFNCGSAVSSGELFSTKDSEVPIYANYYNGTVTISTAADVIKVMNMQGMFLGCSSLTSLDLSNFDTSNVTDMALLFEDCSSLTSINLSNFDTRNVTNMGELFARCSSLTSLDLSEFDTSNVTRMSSMFSGCSSLTSLNLSNFDTSNVTIMSGMFSDCSSLTSLDLSNFVTSNVTNMEYMFSGCSSLTSLNLSNFDTSSVLFMNQMFSNCSSFTSLDLSNFDTSSVEHMFGMFSDCSSLTSIDLSNFVTSSVELMIGMFSDCSSLTSLDLSNFDISNVEDMSSMCNGLASNASSITIKCNVGTQAVLCNRNTGLDQSKVVWSLSEVSAIDINALNRPDNYVPEATIFGSYYVAENLKYTIDTTNKTATLIGQVEDSIVNLFIPSAISYAGIQYRVTAIDDYAFSNNNIETVIISQNVWTIGKEAFNGCSKLTCVINKSTIPQNITSATFTPVENITLYVLRSSIDTYKSRTGWQDFSSIQPIPLYSPESSGSMGNNITFQYFSETREIVITGTGEMKYDSNSSPLYYSNIRKVSIDDGITSLCSGTFSYCHDLISVKIPSSVTKIRDNAFIGCSSLSSIELPTGITTLEWQTFAGCSSLTSIEIPFGVTSISNMVFHGCTSLSLVNIPSSVTSLGSMVFYGCSSLRSIEIPESVTSFGTYVFMECYSLTSIINYAKTPQEIKEPESFFYGVPESCIIYVPTGCKDAYLSAAGWNKFRIVEMQVSSGEENDHEFVDLGLPSGTLWATTNIGASQPEEYGLYFAWGETVGRPQDISDGYSFDWENYKYCDGTENSMNKYCAHEEYGTVDMKTQLDSEDDAAHVNWQGKWKMPTFTQIRELVNNCEWTSVEYKGIKGYLVTSKVNNNHIFLPKAGRRMDSSFMEYNDFAFYWSSSVSDAYCNLGHTLMAWDDNNFYYFGDRRTGHSIRPVMSNNPNLWSAVESGDAFVSVTRWFGQSDWSPCRNPEWSHEGNVWTVTMPEGMGDKQWQGQFSINTSLSASMSDTYNFSCTLDADNDCKGVTIKLFETEDNNNFFFEDRQDVAANESSVYTVKDVSLSLNNAQALSLVFDFGGTPVGTHVKISNITLTKN